MLRLFFTRYYFWIATFVLVLLTFISKAQSGLYYRSVTSGDWSDISIWEVSSDVGFSSIAGASVAPNQSANVITIQNGHIVSIVEDVVIDEVVVDFGGKLILSNASLLNVGLANGIGTDLLVNGILEDQMFASLNWSSGAKWKAGTQSTFIKISSSSATAWQFNYENGSSTIPSTHTWIYRKQTTDNPSVTLASANYGNLRFDNQYDSYWDATSFTSKLTGSANSGKVKGNFFIGNDCKIYLENSASQPLLVMGDFEIDDAGVLVLNASNTGGARGVEIQGDVIIKGALNFNTTGATDMNRLIQFSGSQNQFISSVSPLIFYNIVVNKTAGRVSLLNDISVTNTLTFTNGIIDLNTHSLQLENGNANTLIYSNGGIYAEDVLFQGKFKRVIGQVNAAYLFPFTTSLESVAVTLYSNNVVNNERVGASTYNTSDDNLPAPYLNQIQLTIPGALVSDAVNDVGNRYWLIDAPSTLDVNSLDFTYVATELNSNISSWDLVQNSTGNSWGRKSLGGTPSILTASVSTNISGVWSAVSANIPLGFPEIKNENFNDLNAQEIIPEVDIYSLEGLLLKKYKNISISWIQNELTEGIYFLRLIYDNHLNTVKIGVK